MLGLEGRLADFVVTGGVEKFAVERVIARAPVECDVLDVVRFARMAAYYVGSRARVD